MLIRHSVYSYVVKVALFASWPTIPTSALKYLEIQERPTTDRQIHDINQKRHTKTVPPNRNNLLLRLAGWTV